MATIRHDNSKVLRTKIVNINARIPVKTVAPPIYGVKNGIEMTISDILKCLTRRAIVHQVLSDGSTIQLTTKNFREDYEGQLQKKLKLDKKLAKNKEVITEPTIIDSVSESVDEVHDENESIGDIDNLNLTDDNAEKASNDVDINETMVEHDDVEPNVSEPVDEEENTPITEAAEEKPEEAVPAGEVTESEETETIEEPVVSEEKPTSSKKKNNSKKSGSKKN